MPSSRLCLTIIPGWEGVRYPAWRAEIAAEHLQNLREKTANLQPDLSHNLPLILAPSLSVHVSLFKLKGFSLALWKSISSHSGVTRVWLQGRRGSSSFCLTDPCCTSLKMKGGGIRLWRLWAASHSYETGCVSVCVTCINILKSIFFSLAEYQEEILTKWTY